MSRERQQPRWPDRSLVRRIRAELSRSPELVRASDLRCLREGLAAAAEGRALVLQAGDCAESFHESAPAQVAARIENLDRGAKILHQRTGLDVLRIGRMAGQYAKPRSSDAETVDGERIPAFRGHLVNSEVPDAAARVPDPRRLLTAYRLSAQTMAALDTARGRAGEPVTGPWSSHEALLVDYEFPQLRTTPDGERFLASTHLPWIGARTCQPDGEHARLLCRVTNPIGCKVSADLAPDTLAALCARLDPRRERGKLVLVCRLGRGRVADTLPSLLRAVRAGGHKPLWVCDPMHGNTRRLANGYKTRLLDDLRTEVGEFLDVLGDEGVRPGGLHLEVTPEPATECVSATVAVADVPTHYTSLCDPRLNPDQVAEVLDAWRV